jgi:hypothetical protein
MENKEMNFNYNECIKQQDNIGETIYHNICTNETYKVSWGGDNWIFGVALFILIILMIIGLFKVVFDVF